MLSLIGAQARDIALLKQLRAAQPAGADPAGTAGSGVRYAVPVLRQFYFWYGYRSEARTVARQVPH